MCSYEFPVFSTARLVAIDLFISKNTSFKWIISEKVSKVEAGMPCMEELEIHCDSLTFVTWLVSSHQCGRIGTIVGGMRTPSRI